MNEFFDIRQTVEKKLIDYCKANSLTVSLENVAFIKPTQKSYLQLFFMASETINPDVAAKREREYGYFQINIFTEQGIGAGKAEKIFQDLKELFPVLPKFENFSIECPPKKGPAINTEDGYYLLPITFYYRQERIQLWQ